MKYKNGKQLTRNEWVILFLGTTILFGAIPRFSPGIRAGFPLNDGGVFLIMISVLFRMSDGDVIDREKLTG